MLSTIARPFGVLLMWLYELTTNYGVAIILFALIVKLIMMPFQIKSKKSMARTTRLQPQVKELEKQYGSDPQKYQMEVQKLYRENHINPMSGCLWTLLPFPILLALYQAIRFPLTIMMGVPGSLLEEGGAILEKLNSMNFTSTLNKAYEQISQSQFITEHFSDFAGLSDKLKQLSYNFLGLDLAQQPKWNFFMDTDWSSPAVWGKALALFLIPVLAAVITFLSTKLNASTAGNDDSTANTMKSLNYTMPLITLVFGFMMPAAIGLYWICSMGFSAIQDAVLNKRIKAQLADEEADYRQRMAEKEAKLEAKRKETERLYAENGGSFQNKNTSKSKIQKNLKDAQRAKESEWERQHAKAEETAEEITGRVGKRTYARGRAYDPDRYKNTESRADDAGDYQD
ncbi:MAG: membrane protein insertase YidC [Oscillospiraceae bacterium]|nr:membrane protein insertase YidC [Oscillospiraceae bacterium]